MIDCDLSNYYLLRTTQTNKHEELWDDEMNMLREDCICNPKERISDLSTSLFGIYNTEHIVIELTDKGKKDYGDYCAPDEEVEPPTYDVDFTKNNEKYFWCAPIERLANKEFEYTRANEKYKATCLVKHTPTKWNFWHFSLHWSTDLGLLEELDDKQKAKVARRIALSVRSLICLFATIKSPEIIEIPKDCYCKKSSKQLKFINFFLSYLFL